jgi:hypothetical protein
MYVKDRMVVLFAANIAHFDRNHEAGVHILISRVQVLGNCSVVPSVQKSGYEGVRRVRRHSRNFIFSVFEQLVSVTISSHACRFQFRDCNRAHPHHAPHRLHQNIYSSTLSLSR